MAQTPARLIERGMRAQHAGERHRARGLYKRVLAADPRHVDALHLLGTLAFQEGEFQVCVDWIARALAVGRHPVMLTNQGLAYDALGRLAEAAACFREAAGLRPDDAAIQLRLGDVLMRRELREEAIAAYQEALRCDAGLSDALAGLCNALRLAGRFDEARAAAERALAINPASASACVDLGAVLYDAGDLGGARHWIERAIGLDPSAPVAFHNLGCVLTALGETDAAVDVLRRAVELASDDAGASFDLGSALLRQGRLEEAARCLERAVALDPSRSDARHFLGVAQRSAAPRAAAAYVREVFDHYAAHFDHHLVEELEYRTPWVIAAALRALPGAGDAAWDVLDLGAGTGLMGPLLRQHARSLIGIDLSPQMLAQAAKRGVYDRLDEADIMDFVSVTAADSFDVVVAADVFVYLGDLDRVFFHVARLLRPGGLFAFSLESATVGEEPYTLASSGRYQHTRAYLDSLCAAHRFDSRDVRAAVLRKESSDPIAGWVAVLGKAAAT